MFFFDEALATVMSLLFEVPARRAQGTIIETIVRPITKVSLLTWFPPNKTTLFAYKYRGYGRADPVKLEQLLYAHDS